MSCALHTTTNGLGYSMNSSGYYSTFAPPCTCSPAWRAAVVAAEAAGIDVVAQTASAAAAAAAAMVAGAAEESYLPPRRTDTYIEQRDYMPPARSMTSYGPGTGAGGGAGAAAAGGGLPSPMTVPRLSATRVLPMRTNGGGIQPGDLDGLAVPAPTLSRSMTGAYTGVEPGFSNRTPTLFRESRFSTHSTEEGEADGAASSASALPPVQRTGTEHHGVRWAAPPETELERLKEETRSKLHQLLYALQEEIERPQIFRSHDEMAAHDAQFTELDEQIEATLRLLTLLN
jgi:hypothetical protein